VQKAIRIISKSKYNTHTGLKKLHLTPGTDNKTIKAEPQNIIMHQDPLGTCDSKNMAHGHNQYLPDAHISTLPLQKYTTLFTSQSMD
jgi:hypothetical protein